MPEPPKNTPDKGTDSHVNVDMQGRAISPPRRDGENKDQARQREQERTERMHQVSNTGQ